MNERTNERVRTNDVYSMSCSHNRYSAGVRMVFASDDGTRIVAVQVSNV